METCANPHPLRLVTVVRWDKNSYWLEKHKRKKPKPWPMLRPLVFIRGYGSRSPRTVTKIWNDWKDCSRNTKESSVNNANFCSVPLLITLFYLIVWLRGSINRANKNGHPCLIPCFTWKEVPIYFDSHFNKHVVNFKSSSILIFKSHCIGKTIGQSQKHIISV